MSEIDPRAPYLVTWAPSRALPHGSQIVVFGRRLLDYPAGADSIVLLTPARAEVMPSLPPQRLCTTCGMDRDDEDGCQCPCLCDGITDCPRHDGQPGDEG